MIRSSNLPATLLFYLVACMAAGALNSVYAAPTISLDAVRNATETTSENVTATISGKVIDILTSSGITYVEVDTGKEKVWAAGPVETPLKKGDTVAFLPEMAMQNYHSKYLDRDFSVIYFIKQFITDRAAAPAAAPGKPAKPPHEAMPAASATKVTDGEVRVGGRLRDVDMDGLNGNNKKFSDYLGKPLIINMWASWCPPCRAEMGSLIRLAERNDGKQFTIIGISTDDYRDRAEAFIKEASITFDNFIDHNLQLEKMLGAKTLPLTILVDGNGHILVKVDGAREWDSPKIVAAIEKAFQIKLPQ